jgi:hypothetical protein
MLSPIKTCDEIESSDSEDSSKEINVKNTNEIQKNIEFIVFL